MVIKYALLQDEKTKACSVGIGADEFFYKRIGMELLEVEEAWNGQWYLAGYAPKKTIPSEPTVEEKVKKLESDYEMSRWQREGILSAPENYSELTIARAKEIEALAASLRGQGE